MHLNPNQKKAVRTTEGKVLVLAGAGSGKTNVIIHRIAYLIKEKNISPENILGMTFTNKAAEEMRSRIAKLVDSALAQKLTLCTFHSFCMQILRAEIEHLGYTRSFSLYDEGDMKRLLKQLSRQILEHEGELPSMESTFQLIKEAKTRGEFVQTGNSWHESFAKRLWDSLENCLRAYNALDFDNLLSLTVKLFSDFPQVLEKYRKRYRYIMVDEYQDTNQIQYQLITLLCGKQNHLCVVGDDDQAIYSWRGAEVEHILNFPYTDLIKLEQNYRSTPLILKAAHMVIKENKKRHPKELWSDKSGGDQLRLFFAPTDEDEAKAVIERIALLKEERGYKWKDCAILYRSNLLSRPFEMALLQASWQDQGKWQRGIPYQIFGGTELYERSEIKDLFAYLRAIANPMDQEALLRIINFPRRGISLQTLDLVTTENRKLRIPLWQLLKNIAAQNSSLSLTKQAEKGISIFVEFIERAQKIFSQMPLHEALKWCIHELHLEDALKEDTKSEKAINYKWQNILECVALAEEYQNVPLEDFISSTVLDQRNLPDSKKKNFFEDRVSLMTFHGAKGLEFKACFLVGVEDHLIPHEKSVQEGRIEEERRLFYVAMTRAKEYLSISTSKKRKRQGGELMTNPSRFLLSIPQELLKIAQWKIPSI